MEIISQVWRNNYEPARRHNSFFTNEVKSQNLSSTFKYNHYSQTSYHDKKPVNTDNNFKYCLSKSTCHL